MGKVRKYARVRQIQFVKESFPFLVVALGWGIIGFLILYFWFEKTDTRLEALSWWFRFWFLAVCDLFFLAKGVASLLQIMSEPVKSYSFGKTLALFFWGTMKVVCLGIILLLLVQFRDAPAVSIILGLTTLVVVPLFGGIFWSLRNGR